jgi:hypothetical protein
VTETRDPSPPETRADSSGIALHNDVVAVRARGALLPSEVPVAVDVTEGIAIRDRELRAFCRLLLGSSEARSAVVDDAVDGLLAAIARRMPIALRGTSDLVPVAYALHRRILGADRPFVVCLAARASESDRLLQDALDEAAMALGTARLRIPRRLRQDALERVASFAELEKAALRVVALVSARNPSHAAECLEMAPVSLTRWSYRRPWLMAIVRELKARRDHDDD